MRLIHGNIAAKDQSPRCRIGFAHSQGIIRQCEMKSDYAPTPRPPQNTHIHTHTQRQLHTPCVKVFIKKAVDKTESIMALTLTLTPLPHAHICGLSSSCLAQSHNPCRWRCCVQWHLLLPLWPCHQWCVWVLSLVFGYGETRMRTKQVLLYMLIVTSCVSQKQ